MSGNPEATLNPYFRMCAQESWNVGLNSVESVLKKIDDDITFKEIDKKRKPYAVVNTLSLCIKDSIAAVLHADPRGDDRFLIVEEACEEPSASIIDNFKGAPKVTIVPKEESV